MAGLFRHLFPIALAVLLAAPAPSHAKVRHDKAAQQAQREQAAVAFQRDLVSVLAPQADALPLLGAALLARPLDHQPPANGFHQLIQRAATAPGHGPAQSWAQLSDCDAGAGACPNAAAIARLLEQAPDNAAVWLLKLGQDLRDGHDKEARADLVRAAAAHRYDDYTGTSLMALAQGVGVLPPPAEAIDPAGGGAAGLQAVMVFGIGNLQPQPALQAASQLCEEAPPAEVKQACLALGKTLEWGSSPLARSLGLHLREVLADDPQQQAEARRARRDLIWQVQQFARLSARMSSDKALAQHLLALARKGGTEMSLVLASLRDSGIPADAPADWRSHASD